MASAVNKDDERQRQVDQLSDLILMVVPAYFGFNYQTFETNPHQEVGELSDQEKQDHAMAEFRAMVNQLKGEGIQVIIAPSRPNTPDAVFPNNWISFHDDVIVIYPMLAPNRRAEKNLEVVKQMLEANDVRADHPILDLSALEKRGHFLEGTGSMVLDRDKKVTFACLSPRTTTEGLHTFAHLMGYEVVEFSAFNLSGEPFYHTNVVMSIGENFAVICLDAITDQTERAMVEQRLIELNKVIIPITLEQAHEMCGNVLQVKTGEGNKIVMSETAHAAFSDTQKELLKQHGKLVVVKIPVIEKVGGGSARCMMAEVHPYSYNSGDDTTND